MSRMKSILGLAIGLAVLIPGLTPAPAAAQSDLGEIATELISCFASCELQLNDMLSASIGSGADEPYQSMLLEIHRAGAVSSSTALRKGVRAVPRFGTLTERGNLSKFEQIARNSLILEQCDVVLAMLDDPLVGDAARQNAASNFVVNSRDLLEQLVETMDGRLAPWVVPQFAVLKSIEATASAAGSSAGSTALSISLPKGFE